MEKKKIIICGKKVIIIINNNCRIERARDRSTLFSLDDFSFLAVINDTVGETKPIPKKKKKVIMVRHDFLNISQLEYN